MSKPKRKPQKSEWEERFWDQCRTSGIPLPVRQFAFAKCIGRKYAADFAWPDERLIVEIQGGIFVGGRHNHGAGFEADLERNNLASSIGWKVLQFSPRHVRSGWGLELTKVALGLQDLTREMTRAKEWK